MSKLEQMIEQFQCPGCVVGSDTKCGKYLLTKDKDCCDSHVVGTSVIPGGHIVLGMPKGFNKVGFHYGHSGTIESPNKVNLHFYTKDEHEKARIWDKCNIPVWALEQDGYLFVRVYMPRINFAMVQVIEGGTLDMISDQPFYNGFRPLDVARFQGEID